MKYLIILPLSLAAFSASANTGEKAKSPLVEASKCMLEGRYLKSGFEHAIATSLGVKAVEILSTKETTKEGDISHAVMNFKVIDPKRAQTLTSCDVLIESSTPTVHVSDCAEGIKSGIYAAAGYPLAGKFSIQFDVVDYVSLPMFCPKL